MGWTGTYISGVRLIWNPKRHSLLHRFSLSLVGLVMLALTAALMSTVDTLITAISAIVVNDITDR